MLDENKSGSPKILESFQNIFPSRSEKKICGRPAQQTTGVPAAFNEYFFRIYQYSCRRLMITLTVLLKPSPSL
jgi:hypothetical protein